MGLILSLNNSIQSFNTGKFVLDQYTGAAAAYSLRRLSVNSTNVVRVRRSSDNAEADFTADEITDGTMLNWVNEDVEKIVNGNFATDSDWTKGTGWTISGGAANCDGTQTSSSELKTAVGIAIQGVEVTFSFQVKNYSAGTLNATIEGTGGNEFSGINANGVYSTTATSSDSLPRVTFTASSDFVGSIDNVSVIQTTADGYVTTWYDQTGNGNDATQATAANQPKIVDAGLLVEENGRPAVEFDGTDDSLLGASTITNEYVSIFTIFNTTKNFGSQYVAGVSNETTGKRRASWINTTNYYSSGFNANFLISSISTNTQYLGVNLFDNANDEINGAINGSLSTASSFTITPLSSPVIGIGNGGTFTEYTKGTIQEIIIFDSDQSANRTGIETNINNYYSIYP